MTEANHNNRVHFIIHYYNLLFERKKISICGVRVDDEDKSGVIGDDKLNTIFKIRLVTI